MRTVFLVNPAADRVAKRGSLLQAVADYEDKAVRILDGHYRPEAADRVYVEGGDGTLQWVVSAYLDSGLPLPQFAAVKGGTTNQVAGILGLRNQTTNGLRESLTADLILSSVKLLEVETGSETRYGFLFSSGAIPQVTERIADYRGENQRAGLQLVGRAVIGAVRPGSRVLSASDASITADTDTEHVDLRGAHLGTLVTTLPSLYVGLDPFWGEGDGDLRVTYADGEASALLPTILGLWTGRKDVAKLRARGFQSFNAHSLQVRTPGGMVLDGEALETDSVIIRPSRAVSFVR